jgi:SAM-dependent methyltransferase
VATFEHFLQKHKLYESALKELTDNSRLLEVSASLVYENQGEALGPVADEILRFVEHAYGPHCISTYISRVNDLAMLQKRFDADPSAATLGDRSAFVDSDAYALGLLLSIVFTNHRFELISELELFLKDTRERYRNGAMLSIGFGAGYELAMASEILTGWHIEGYDTDPEIRAKARRLLDFFGVPQDIYLGGYFPLDRCSDELRGRYDAVVLSEVLEHLEEPAQALVTLRDCLRDDGRMFVTMAINIAQEDHVFLYPTIDSCREQIRQCGLVVGRERISPQTIFVIPEEDREKEFKKGNYIAVLEKQGRT